MKSDRLSELSRIADKGAEISWHDWLWIAPNYWISPATAVDFESRGLTERKENRVVVTEKGKKVLHGSISA